jgi:hypothetical protein
LILFNLFTDLVRACLGFLEPPSSSCVRASAHGAHNRTAALLLVDRETVAPGPT